MTLEASHKLLTETLTSSCTEILIISFYINILHFVMTLYMILIIFIIYLKKTYSSSLAGKKIITSENSSLLILVSRLL